MSLQFKNSLRYLNGRFIQRDFSLPLNNENETLTFSDCYVFPGFTDVHVHLRDPGFTYKETMLTGTLAAAHGGYTNVCAMPNLNPVPDSVEHLNEVLRPIEQSAVIHVHPYGAVTIGEKGSELADMDGMASRVIAFSDDGHGVQSDSMMRSAMEAAKRLGKIISAHCEINSLLRNGYIHDGRYAAAHGHRGICSESEWGQIKRDIELAAETGCAYHVCHISTKESVSLIRSAKAKGVNITCETAPHYLLLCEDDLQEDGRFKMNPPLRSREDHDALIEGLVDGTIDMIATDHAPHSAEEKSRGLEKSAMGIVGIETAFPLLYTYLVKKNIISLERLAQLLIDAPCTRFNIPHGNDLCVWNLNTEAVINPDEFLSMGKATPFDGWSINAENLLTVCDGNIVWKK